ncbi:hypothetical protein [Chamaesiphon polymorphus]|uniref:Uncharacterized protein n=1 Tax=Chamaesiphon polymorphus CCALA 037 TaxID=2107692 RepID=A0A2T1GIK0_9CYAN|nr:hypothetical protein [Chamaesiphon polymorphus]PSB57532.1 hypothetical protein C7B77_08005 [Chamaesiphon polymorphus CCALA 037]
MNVLTLDESLLIWTVALESGYIRSSVWVDWAEKQILELDSPPFWLLEVSLANTVEQASILVRKHIKQTHQATWNSIDYNDLYIGFLYLQFERGDLKLAELLMLAGKFADGKNYKIDCSKFFSLFDEIDNSDPIIPSLKERVEELFKPMVKLAKYYRSRLPAIATKGVQFD